MPSFATIDDYIAHQSKELRPILEEMRGIIREAAPDAIEGLNYKVPCFSFTPESKMDQQIMMAGYATFIGFYPFPTTIAAFSEELNEYKKGKGSVQFPLNKPLPKDLIMRMVKYKRNEVLGEQQ